MKKPIKVNAPKTSPHICYIPREYEDKVKEVKSKSGKSLYRLICESAGTELSEKSQIQAFKKSLRNLGYKTIGDWAAKMLNTMISSGMFEKAPKPTKREE